MPKVYEEKAVSLAIARREIKKFIESQEEQADPNFLGFIERKLNDLKNTAIRIDTDTHYELYELLDQIDNIWIYIQAIVEANKDSISSIVLRELKNLSEADVDEILGSKIVKIVDIKSEIGNAFKDIYKESIGQNELKKM